MIAILLLAALQSRPGDWDERRGRAALALDTQPGNVALWSDYCVAAWRGGDQSVLTTCAERAPELIVDVARAVAAGRLPSGDSGWALRAQFEGLYAGIDLTKGARRVRMRLLPRSNRIIGGLSRWRWWRRSRRKTSPWPPP